MEQYDDFRTNEMISYEGVSLSENLTLCVTCLDGLVKDLKEFAESFMKEPPFDYDDELQCSPNSQEQRSRGQQTAVSQFLKDNFKNIPQQLPLCFTEPGFASQTGHVAIGLPAIQLPGIHDFAPLCPEEMLREPVSFHATRCIC